MDILNTILLILHLLALVAGGGVSVGMQTMGRLMPTATPDQRVGYMRLGGALSQIGRFAIGTLVVTGVIMVVTKFGGVEGLNFWFWVKMALVVVMIVGIVISTGASKRIQAGDATAAPLARQGGMISGIALLGVIITAVLAFN
jgi:putative membrane protein